MIDVLPNPVAVQVGPVPVYWYGIGYAVGLAAAYLVMTRIGRKAGEDDELVGNGMIIVAIAALIGGRLYHVIDQWQLYKDDLSKIVLPPYSGLGVYGGIITGTIAAFAYIRWKRAPFARWADVIAPALFTMQAIARWGNFFNQELYGPPTTLPWGIPIDCAHRIAAYPCGPEFPETTAFHPLFLYESISGVLGALFLIWVGFHLRRHCVSGPASDVLHLVRRRSVWTRIAPGRQLDVLRCADGPGRVGRLHRRRGADHGLQAPPRAPARRSADSPRGCNVGRHRASCGGDT